MTAIKMCGLTRAEDIAAVNNIVPAYIGFVFFAKSKRCLTPARAAQLKEMLSPHIQAVGVFVDEQPAAIADLLNSRIIDLAQLHGHETEEDIHLLRTMTDRPIIQAFQVKNAADVQRAAQSSADMILLDAGAGDGIPFDWTLLQQLQRPFILAGGLNAQNVAAAIRQTHPFAVDVSSGIETNGRKDIDKMAAFAAAVRKEDTP